MASNQVRFVKNLLNPAIKEPLIVPGKFAAGASVPIKRGELLELTGSGNTEWVPMDSDFAMSKDVAIAACEIKSGDLAGYYPIIVPRPGDVFEFELAAAGASALGTALYWSSSEKVTVTAGANIIGHIAGWPHYSDVFPQNHAADDAGIDKGTTLRTITRAHISIEESNSYFQALQNT
jgi:hypothetical protein